MGSLWPSPSTHPWASTMFHHSQVTGRETDISSYIRHGSKESSIKLELFYSKQSGNRVTLERHMTEGRNDSTWVMNGGCPCRFLVVSCSWERTPSTKATNPPSPPLMRRSTMQREGRIGLRFLAEHLGGRSDAIHASGSGLYRFCVTPLLSLVGGFLGVMLFRCRLPVFVALPMSPGITVSLVLVHCLRVVNDIPCH